MQQNSSESLRQLQRSVEDETRALRAAKTKLPAREAEARQLRGQLERAEQRLKEVQDEVDTHEKRHAELLSELQDMTKDLEDMARKAKK